MAGEITNVTVEGLEPLLKKLRVTVSRSSDLSRVFRFRINPDVSKLFRRRFQDRGASGGSPSGWRPLAPSTVAGRLRRPTSDGGTSRKGARGRNRGGVTRPLWDTGALRDSFLKYSPGSFGYAHVRKLSLERGSTYPTGIFHQEGTGTIPARKIVPDRVDPRLSEGWAKMIAKYIEKGTV